MMGEDKVVVSVRGEIDLRKENGREEIVEGVDKEKMEGIGVSGEKVSWFYGRQ